MADHNLDVFSFPNYNAKMLDVNNGTGVCRVLFAGDSTFEGIGSTSFGNTLPEQIKSLHPEAGEGAVTQSLYNTLWGLGTGWEYWNSSSFGEGGWEGTTSATGNLTFTFPTPIDTITVVYAKGSGFGTFTMNVDGGSALTTINTANGSNALGKTTVTCTAGTHIINVPPPTVGNVFILWVEAYLSTDPTMLICNGGTGGTRTNEWITSNVPWAKVGSFGALAPDLTIISLGINDGISSYNPTDSQSNMNTLVQLAQQTGDVLIVSPVPSVGGPVWTFEQAYMPLIEQVAVNNGCGYLDLTLAGRFVDWNTANANGYMYDIYHPNNAGYAFWSSILNPVLVSIVGSLPPPPVNTVPPAVTGEPIIGQTLTTNNGTWANTVTSYSYQWEFSVDGETNWSPLVGKTSPTLPLI